MKVHIFQNKIEKPVCVVMRLFFYIVACLIICLHTVKCDAYNDGGCQTNIFLKCVTDSLFVTHYALEELNKTYPYKFEFGLYGGTLVAMKRQEKIFAWDHDADMFMVFSNHSINADQTPEILQDFKNKLIEIINQRMKINSSYTGNGETPVDTLTIGVHNLNSIKKCGYVDLWILQINSNKTKIGGSHHAWGGTANLWVQYDWYLPTRKENFKIYDTYVSIPNQN